MKIRYKGQLYKAIDSISPEDISKRYMGEYQEAITEATKAKQRADKIIQLAKKNKTEVEKYLKEFKDKPVTFGNIQKLEDAYNRLYYNAYAASDMMGDGEGVNQGGASR